MLICLIDLGSDDHESAKIDRPVRKAKSTSLHVVNDNKATDIEGPVESSKGNNIKPRSYRYKIGVQEHLKPIHKIPDIFADMIENALKVGLDKFLTHLNGRKLKVATMCSGTESPVLALQLFGEGE
jgi:hypothetical protein